MTRFIGVADMAVSRNPSRLCTIGLGSCVGIVLHDPTARVGALIHAMLPTSRYRKFREKKAKFVDTAVPAAIEEMMKLGAKRSTITARLVGGARMFSGYEKGDFIGERNVQAAKRVLQENGIRIVACETGGDVGRTVEFDISTGRVLVKTAMRGTKEL